MKYSQEDQNTLAMVETNLGNIWDPQVGELDYRDKRTSLQEWEAYVDSREKRWIGPKPWKSSKLAFDTYLEATGN